MSSIQDFSAQNEGDIVLHGTPRIVQVGDILEPRISKRPVRSVDSEVMQWGALGPYVFGTYPEYPDVATFTATVMGIAPPCTAGIREEVPGQPLAVDFMANSGVVAMVKRRNPVATVCVLPGESFSASPRRSRLEVVSNKSVQVIGAWLVQYSALSFSLDEVSPNTIPGVSAEELAILVAQHRT